MVLWRLYVTVTVAFFWYSLPCRGEQQKHASTCGAAGQVQKSWVRIPMGKISGLRIGACKMDAATKQLIEAHLGKGAVEAAVKRARISCHNRAPSSSNKPLQSRGGKSKSGEKRVRVVQIPPPLPPGVNVREENKLDKTESKRSAESAAGPTCVQKDLMGLFTTCQKLAIIWLAFASILLTMALYFFFVSFLINGNKQLSVGIMFCTFAACCQVITVIFYELDAGIVEAVIEDDATSTHRDNFSTACGAQSFNRTEFSDLALYTIKSQWTFLSGWNVFMGCIIRGLRATLPQ